MDMLKLCGVAICGALTALAVRRMKPESGMITALAAGVLLSLMLLPRLTEVIRGVTEIAQLGGLADGYLGQLLKVCGVSLLIDFAVQTCRDAGEAGLAAKVELAGRATLIALALPFMQALLTQILSLSP